MVTIVVAVSIALELDDKKPLKPQVENALEIVEMEADGMRNGLEDWFCCPNGIELGEVTIDGKYDDNVGLILSENEPNR